MRKTAHVGAAKPWHQYAADRAPSVALVRRQARSQGYELRQGRSKGFVILNDSAERVAGGSIKSAACWLVDARLERLATPRLDLDSIWTALVLPRGDERTRGLWLD